jgi:hypothetical protein
MDHIVPDEVVEFQGILTAAWARHPDDRLITLTWRIAFSPYQV